MTQRVIENKEQIEIIPVREVLCGENGISIIKKEYQIDYEKDLIPVCPNCHAMIHRKKNPAYTPDDIKAILKK